MLYYWTLLACIDMAVCHSRAEMANYERLFPSARHKLVHIPFGMTVNRPGALRAMRAQEDDRNAPVISAGRSGRDYATLIEAIRGLPCRLQIICDSEAPLAGIRLPDQVEVIRDCFEEAYIEALLRARLVVVPLAANDISAGQMVLLQAGALGKAAVITRTATTPEYATDGENALLVDLGNVEQMRGAIRRLLENDALRARLGANAALRFERDHSTEVYVRNLIAAIEAALKATRRVRGGGDPRDTTRASRA
ncbi:MAG: glycosyltransferase family 4 protein, partial [Acetobacteraceae bacterium]|nr:glycosyltransferase family 4 protein [Acetobacteraceae bacterium]